MDANAPDGPHQLAHLSRHGVTATIDTDARITMETPEDEIFSRLQMLEADLLIAGAFGHSRLLGGASHAFLRQIDDTGAGLTLTVKVLCSPHGRAASGQRATVAVHLATVAAAERGMHRVEPDGFAFRDTRRAAWPVRSWGPTGKALGDGTLGEFDHRLILDNFLRGVDPDRGTLASSGWTGDQSVSIGAATRQAPRSATLPSS